MWNINKSLFFKGNTIKIRNKIQKMVKRVHFLCKRAIIYLGMSVCVYQQNVFNSKLTRVNVRF